MRIARLAVCLALATAAPGESRPAVTTTGAFFALSVPDANAAAAWYSAKLGLTVVMRPPKAGDATAIVMEGGGLIVEIIQHDRARARGADPVLVHGIAKAGAIIDDFDKTVATLRERGAQIAFGPFPARPGQRANVIVRDIAGNLIQFFGR